MDLGPRNIYITMLTFIGIVFPAAFLFRDSEPMQQVFGVVGFVVAFTLLHALDGRDLRRRRRSGE